MPATAKQPQTAKPDLYETVTARIIAELERGAAPWVQPWSSTAQPGDAFPRNGKTGNFYRGNNIMLLWIAAALNGFTSNEWFGYVQAQELGGQVRAGQKATHIFHTGTTTDKKDGDNDAAEDAGQEPGTRRYVRTLAVFNRDQIDGLPEPIRQEPKPVAERLADVLQERGVARIEFERGGHARGHGARGQPARLEHHDPPSCKPRFVEQRQRHLRGLARAGRRFQHQPRVVLQRRTDLGQQGMDRETGFTHAD